MPTNDVIDVSSEATDVHKDLPLRPSNNDIQAIRISHRI